ncbi:MAG: T9SS type A sorting domain-containing protein, partial [Bacteroidia bacterium]|nr:T9SS type A sorting domain-containing protein [Bacteroidia bacterium]
PRLRALADQLGNEYPGPLYFNGDDAVELVKVDGAAEMMVDLIGKIGEDPGTAWTSLPPYVGSAGRWLTASNTLIRKREVKSGVRSNPVQFNGLAEWDTIAPRPANNDTTAWWAPFGSHVCDCQVADRQSVRNFPPAQIFPNPARDFIRLLIPRPAEWVILRDLSGKTLRILEARAHETPNLDGFAPGVYTAEIRYRDGAAEHVKFVVVK